MFSVPRGLFKKILEYESKINCGNACFLYYFCSTRVKAVLKEVDRFSF